MVAINDPCVSTEEMVRMIKYDSNYGQFPGEVEVGNTPSLPVVRSLLAAQSAGDKLVVGGKVVTVLHEPRPASIPWDKLKVQLVADCSNLASSQVTYCYYSYLICQVPTTLLRRPWTK